MHKFIMQKINVNTIETGKNKMFEIILFTFSSNFVSKDTSCSIGKMIMYNHCNGVCTQTIHPY